MCVRVCASVCECVRVCAVYYNIYIYIYIYIYIPANLLSHYYCVTGKTLKFIINNIVLNYYIGINLF